MASMRAVGYEVAINRAEDEFRRYVDGCRETLAAEIGRMKESDMAALFNRTSLARYFLLVWYSTI